MRTTCGLRQSGRETRDTYEDRRGVPRSHSRTWIYGILQLFGRGAEVSRLQSAGSELRLVLTQILSLADELATGTIERQLSKSDSELVKGARSGSAL